MLARRGVDFMVTAFDVEANRLIGAAAEKLKALNIKEPAYLPFVKSGPDKERRPTQKDFWYLRCAAVLRQAYTRGRVGVSSLRTHFGSRIKRGVRPEKHRRTGGSIIRDAFGELERAGLLEKKKDGRHISAKGKSFLDSVAREISKSSSG